MATAKTATIQIPQAPITPPPLEKKRVILEMSVNEAETLGLLLAKCGGTPGNSRRSYTDSLSAAMKMAGYDYQSVAKRNSLLSSDATSIYLSTIIESPGSLYFKNEKLDPSKD